jgi:small subunit ribosomal protein S16
MLAIRMRRLGAKKRPFYRVVVIDSHKARDGRALEVLGHYNPTTVPETFKLDRERFDHWLARGAQPSDTLRTLLTRPQAEEAVVGSGEPAAVVQAAVPTQVAPAAPATEDGAKESQVADADQPVAESESAVEESVSAEGESAGEGKESTDS